jgi:hypothetical protein
VCSTCLTVCLPTDKGLNVEVKYFQLGSIKIPSDVENRYIQALVNKLKHVEHTKINNKQTIKHVEHTKINNKQT